MKTNPVKEKLKAGQCAVGTMVQGFISAETAPLLRQAGVEFVLIDTEHAPLGLEAVSMLCATSRMAGVTPIVRVPDSEYHLIARRLDAGAAGIMMPRVKTRADVQLIVQSAKYPPEGERGCGIRPLLTDYEAAASLEEGMAWVNEQTLVCIQIETRESIDQIDDLLSVPGVDATIMGPNDLSIALGVPGDHRHPKMAKAIETMIEACRRHGVAPGIHIRDMELLLGYKQQGMQLLACGTDVGFMLQAAGATMRELTEG